MSYLSYFCLFVHSVVCFILCLVCRRLPVSVDCPFIFYRCSLMFIYLRAIYELLSFMMHDFASHTLR